MQRVAALARAGENCNVEGARTCTAHASRRPLLCDGLTWIAEPECEETSRCNTQVGPSLGRCMPLAEECVGETPGEPFCDSEGTMRVCSDLVASDVLPCGTNQRCVENGDRVLCACAPGKVDEGKGCLDAADCSHANGGCDPLTRCDMQGKQRVCGECPKGFRGTGMRGCAPELERLEPSAGELMPALSSGVYSYRIRVPVATQRLSLAVGAPAGVKIEINGEQVDSSWTSPELKLGETSLAVRATSPFAVSSVYEVIVERASQESPLEHDFFATVSVPEANMVSADSNGDLWVSCWSNDDALYAASGDGLGFGAVYRDIAVNRIEGRPNGDQDPLRGTALAGDDAVAPVWNGSRYDRSPTGIVCVDGDLYLAVQDVRSGTYDDTPSATIVRSRDKGKTWTWDSSGPMFRDHIFTTIMFLDFGKDSEHAMDGFVYAYGLDYNWTFTRTTPTPPTRVYLARVARGAVQDRERWRFFAGMDPNGEPIWHENIEARVPVLEDARRLYQQPLDGELNYQNTTVISQGGVVYNAPLHRYIYTSWSAYTFEFYEAPQPWGPWKLFHSKDFGVFPWTSSHNGGYGNTIPSKFISADGRSVWLQSNAWTQSGAPGYKLSLREVRLTPYEPADPTNARGQALLSTAEQAAVPITRALHHGRLALLNDGVIADQTEDSWTGERKSFDYWGYTWPRTLHVNTLHYTTGAVSAAGGWLEDLGVQVRRGTEWVPVDMLSIMPAYTANASLPARTTFTLRFADTATDGVRIVGRPGGTDAFSSIADLSASFE